MRDEAPIQTPLDAPIEAAVPMVEQTAAPAELAPPEAYAESLASLFVLAAWAVPGLGHLLLRRWGKAAVFFAVVAGLVICGCAMHGDLFSPGADGPFGTLGFLADISSGAFYFLSRLFETAGADLSRAAGDYGTRLIAAAGIVNVLAMIDAYQIAARRGV
jgi:hypothetical protein